MKHECEACGAAGEDPKAPCSGCGGMDWRAVNPPPVEVAKVTKSTETAGKKPRS